MIGTPAFNIRVHVLAFVAALALTFPAVAPAGDAPQLDAARAAKIATDYLARLGKNPPYIVSITLQKDGIMQSKRSWIARWSDPVFADGDKEVGLRVNLDGTTVILIEDKSSKSKRRTVSGGDR